MEFLGKLRQRDFTSNDQSVLYYFSFPSFDIERTFWWLFQGHIEHIKLVIYDFKAHYPEYLILSKFESRHCVIIINTQTTKLENKYYAEIKMNGQNMLEYAYILYENVFILKYM